MAAKFEISKDKSGTFRFHLKAANGESSPPARPMTQIQVSKWASSRSRPTPPPRRSYYTTQQQPAHNQHIRRRSSTHAQPPVRAAIACEWVEQPR